ncbi:hypothetical protein BSKO_06272 [Bryopsis sp. KO-2023]|nr:hypothetical protein BSKO_06272 [Bryopsis sp. KO-2023]
MSDISECHVGFLAIGTRGDVQPLCILAKSLKERRPTWIVTLITHKAHENWLGEVLMDDITPLFISASPARRWLVTGDLNVEFDTDSHREECISSLELAIGLTLERRAFGGQKLDNRMIVFNLFSLEAYHFSEAMGIACICVAPQIVPYKAPPGLLRELTKMMKGSESKLGMDEISHWMWPLFTERWGTWRQHRFPLDPFPGKPCMLLYGFSSMILPTPGWLPTSVKVCGFWTDSIRDQQGGSISDSFTTWLKASEKNLLCVDFGSLGSLGFLKSPMRLMTVIATATENLGWRCVFLSAGFRPLLEAHNSLAKHLRENVLLVEASVPHSYLFMKCNSVLHHGGAGTVASCLLGGIPQIISPAHYDQFVWGERLEYLGLCCKPFQGSELFTNEKESGVTDTDVALKLQKSMETCLSETMKNNCTDTAQALAREDGVGSAVECLIKAMGDVSTTEAC